MARYMTNSGYLMEDPREASRLADKVDSPLWVERYLGTFLSDNTETGVPPNSRVLDVGCGPAVLLNEVGRRRPDVRCVGVDVSLQSLSGIAPIRSLPLAAGDANRLPFAEASFDLIYARMVLQYLSNPSAAVAEMVRVCRPGGSVLLQDLDGQLVTHYPPDPELDEELQIVLESLRATGFNPYVGRALYHHAYLAGLSNLKVQVEGYHVIAGNISAELRRQWALKIAIARPAIVAALSDRSEAFIDRLMSYLDRPDTFTFSQQITVVGQRA
jgi:ubiquinone/menaquinone biosynthesis C-methylase UbiE